MIKPYSLLFLALIIHSISFSQVKLEWATYSLCAIPNQTTSNEDIAIDAMGNIFTISSFQNKYIYDYRLNDTVVSYSNSFDILVVKYDPEGNYLDKFVIGYSGDEFAEAIEIDGNGDLLISGRFLGQSDFDPSSNTFYLNNPGSQRDIFLAKYNNEFDLIWLRQFDVQNAYASIYDLKIVEDENIIIHGYINGSIDFDPNSANIFTSLDGNPDIVFAKISSTNGQTIWERHISSPGIEFGSIAIDNDYNLIMNGFFQDSTDLDPSAAAHILYSPPNEYSVYFAKYNSNGNFVMAKKLGGSTRKIGSICFDNANNMYISGAFSDSTDMDINNIQVIPSPTNKTQIFITKYDSNYNLLWYKTFANIDNSLFCHDLKVRDNNIYCLISTHTKTVFDADPNDDLLVTSESYCHLLNLDTDGNYKFNLGLGTNYIQAYSGMYIDDKFNLMMAGEQSENNSDIDPSDEIFPINSCSMHNSFFAKYNFSALNENTALSNHDSTRFNIYPNPSKNIIYIDAVELYKKNQSISVYNTIGELVYHEKEVENPQVNIGSLPAGVYFVSLKKDELIFHSSFVKEL